MDAKRRGKQVVGGLLTLVGCGLSLGVLRRLLVFGQVENVWTVEPITRRLWNIGTLVLLAALSAYLVCSGLRIMNPQLVKPFRFEWGKIIFGALILYMQVGFDYQLVPEGPVPIHKPSNLSQAVSVIAFDLIGVYLIFRGIRQGFTRSESQPDTLPLQPPESGR
jgi:hypothetical protein